MADGSLVLPVAAAILLLLVALGETRNALLWTLAVGGVLGTILVLKLTFAGCWPPSPYSWWRSPSGHTSSAAMVYGGFAAVVGLGVAMTFAQSLAVAVLIGASRIMLGHHSPSEAILGGTIGVLGATAFAAFYRPVPRRAGRRSLVLAVGAGVLVLAVLLHGHHLESEALIDRLSWRFWPLRACTGLPS